MAEDVQNKCPVTGLPVLILPEYSELLIGEDYYISLKKIGNSIVYIDTRANLRNYDIEKFNAVVEDFCAVAGVIRPCVQIRNLAHVTGRPPLRLMKKQVSSFLENQDQIIGVVFIEGPKWIKPFINQGLNLFKPKFKVSSVYNYADAVIAAKEILDGKYQKLTDISMSTANTPICFDNIRFKPEWEYENAGKTFRCRIGCIPETLLYISLHGVLKHTEDITRAGSLLKNVIIENRLTGIPYILTNFSELAAVKSLRLRQQFAKEVKNGIAESDNEKALRILINPDRFNMIALKFFAPFLRTEFVFVNSVEKAFERIKSLSANLKADSINKDIYVNATDLEEISNAFGTLQWGELEDMPEAKVSPENPLAYLAESLELVKNDLNEMRKNETRIQEERLRESETSRRKMMKILEDAQKAKAALEREEESKRILLDNIQTQIWYLADETTYGAVNKAHADFKGMKTEDMAFKSFYDLYPEDVVAEWKQSNSKVFDCKKPAQSERWITNAQGEQRYIATTKTPKLCAEGKVEYVVCSANDLTERKLAEERIDRHQREIAEIYRIGTLANSSLDKEGVLNLILENVSKTLNASVGMVFLKNPLTGFLEWGASLGLSKEFVDEFKSSHIKIGEGLTGTIARTKDPVFIQEDSSNDPRIARSVIKREGLNSFIGVPILAGDEVIGVMNILTRPPFRLSKDDLHICSAIGSQIGLAIRNASLFSQQKKVKQELIAAKEKAEESNRLKSSFLQIMSHEIRTPLNAIIGFSQRIDSPKITVDKRRLFADIIVKSGFQLLSIVTDILTISSIDTGQEKLDEENVCINSLISETLEVFRQQAHGTRVTIKTVKPLPDPDSEVLTDRIKLTQILNNLLSNAVKFTPAGEIVFGYSLKDGELEFYVKDNGIGIDNSKHEAIFERFVQADDKIHVDYGGTGLGLSICKGFVELLGGRIWVESEPGKGATFCFTIPLKQEKALNENNDGDPPDQPESPLAKNKTVLVAEDQIYNYIYIEELLTELKFKVIHARDGKEAVDICKKNKSIDIILMDIKMPVMDGQTASLQIKKFRPELKIIAQTAYATLGEIEKYKKAFDDYITKPITAEKLTEIVFKHL